MVVIGPHGWLPSLSKGFFSDSMPRVHKLLRRSDGEKPPLTWHTLELVRAALLELES
jgi:hypothetical protein